MVTAKNAETVYLLSGDIEWEIAMPLNDIQSLSLKSESRIVTWLYHKEDQMKLFGFLNEKRRTTFLELVKVEGIGPKGALKIMSGINQEDLETALENEDLARLEAVPGLGKKTAQKMLLTLKGKLISLRDPLTQTSPYNDLAEALVNMGYDKRAVMDALAKAEAAVAGKELNNKEKEEVLLKEAIVYLSGA